MRICNLEYVQRAICTGRLLISGQYCRQMFVVAVSRMDVSRIVPGSRRVTTCSNASIRIKERTATWQKDPVQVFLLTGAR